MGALPEVHQGGGKAPRRMYETSCAADGTSAVGNLRWLRMKQHNDTNMHQNALIQESMVESVVGKRRKKPQWAAPKVKVMRVSDGEKLSWTATTAFEVLNEDG